MCGRWKMQLKVGWYAKMEMGGGGRGRGAGAVELAGTEAMVAGTRRWGGPCLVWEAVPRPQRDAGVAN
jgi:hypothetical protein